MFSSPIFGCRAATLILLEWTYQTPQYHLYNVLAGHVATIISTENPTRQTRPQDAASTLQRITALRPVDWERAVSAQAVPRMDARDG